MSIGEPAGLNVVAPAVPAHAGGAAGNQAMEDATRGLAERLAKQPDDRAGWLLLVRAYKVMQKYDEALAALTTAGARWPDDPDILIERRSEEHTSELQSLMRISYAVFCLKKKNNYRRHTQQITDTTHVL